MTCYTTAEIAHGRNGIVGRQRAKKVPALKKFWREFPNYCPHATVCCLIGTNCKEAFIPLDVLVDPNENFYGVRTRLGWGIVGLKSGDESEEGHEVICRQTAANEESSYRIKEERFQKVNPVDVIKVLEQDFATEIPAYQTEYVEKYRIMKPLSIEDRRFLAICEKGMTIEKDGHFKMPLPLRNRDFKLPNNKALVERRLRGIKRKLETDDEYGRMYTEFMNGILEKGYAEEVSPQMTSQQDWFLPHFGVVNPNKKNKVRVVFDCAARMSNVSLNDQLMTGPDLANNLLGVLLRFRKGKIAVIGDITEMFYQIKVDEGFRNLLKFLWWPGGDTTVPPREYRMCVHPFGAASSPGCANLALKTAANMNKGFDEEAAESVKKNFYVDDLLLNGPDVETVTKLVKNIREICRRGGFHLTKFTSNSKEVLDNILEVLNNMTSDSMINALRRFVGRNGPVRQIRCDNGTNFVGASEELKRQLNNVDMSRVKRAMLQEDSDLIEFKFRTAKASHMGGVWERQIRTTRSVLEAILAKNSKQLNDDALSTYLIEVETIVNQKPLTYKTLGDPNELIPLTPQQLITTKTKRILAPPGKFERADLYSRKYWRRVQHLANEFWTRWTKEYRNTLHERGKWHNAKESLKVDDIVLMVSDEERSKWKLARVTETYPDGDGLVRKVKVRVANANLDATGRPKGKTSELEDDLSPTVQDCFIIQKNITRKQTL